VSFRDFANGEYSSHEMARRESLLLGRGLTSINLVLYLGYKDSLRVASV
jgi:hypothetical protein